MPDRRIDGAVRGHQMPRREDRRDPRREERVVCFGDAAVQHNDLDGAPDPQCAVVLCAVSSARSSASASATRLLPRNGRGCGWAGCHRSGIGCRTARASMKRLGSDDSENAREVCLAKGNAESFNPDRRRSSRSDHSRAPVGSNAFVNKAERADHDHYHPGHRENAVSNRGMETCLAQREDF